MPFQIYHPGVYSREGTQVRQEQQTSQQSQGRHPAGMQEKEVFLRRIKGCAKDNNSPKQGIPRSGSFLETVIVFKLFCGQQKDRGRERKGQ